MQKWSTKVHTSHSYTHLSCRWIPFKLHRVCWAKDDSYTWLFSLGQDSTLKLYRSVPIGNKPWNTDSNSSRSLRHSQSLISHCFNIITMHIENTPIRLLTNTLTVLPYVNFGCYGSQMFLTKFYQLTYTLRWWSIFVQHEEKTNTDVSLHGGIEALENTRHHICQSLLTTQLVKSEALTVTLQLDDTCFRIQYGW